MYSVLKRTLLFTCALFSFVAMAGDNEPTLMFKAEENAKTMIFELDEPAEDASINFTDAKGRTLFVEDISERSGYIKKFNLRNLKRGNYQLTTENKIRKIVYTISVGDSNARLLHKNIVAKPHYRFKNDKVYVHLPATDAKKVYVSIYNDLGVTVLEESFDNQNGTTKVYNFSESQKDAYSVRVWDKNGVYMQTFEVK